MGEKGDEGRNSGVGCTMTGVSLGLRTGSYGSLQLQTQTHIQNGVLQTQNVFVVRKPKMSLGVSREKERFLSCMFRYLSRKKVGMLLLVSFALLAFMSGFFTVNREDAETNSVAHFNEAYNASFQFPRGGHQEVTNSSMLVNKLVICEENAPTFHSSVAAVVRGSVVAQGNPCEHFAFPPPPPAYRSRPGPRPCPVCYRSVEQALASMPSSPSTSPVLKHLTYYHEEDPIKTERHGGSDFGGFPSLRQRNESFAIKESMTVHCGFVKGCRPGHQTGFDIDLSDLKELEQFHEVIVASAIFGNYDAIQQPMRISDISRTNIPFYMFIDEETEAYMRNNNGLDSTMKVGLWRIIVVHNIPYSDARRNGKVPKLLLHRLFPNVRYSIWIDGKLQLVADPYKILERFLWRQNATFAISRHYRRFDVFEEAEANKAAGKYDNASIDDQIDFYRKEGLTPYSEAKLPITSDVPEGCVIIREHIPITNLFTCLWFNEVDRFTSRDQLSFSTVRDKIMAQVNWSISMFMDCERRNFVVQAYHRDVWNWKQRAPPAAMASHLPAAVVRSNTTARIPVKKNPIRRGKGERRGSRRRRKSGGNRDKDNMLF